MTDDAYRPPMSFPTTKIEVTKDRVTVTTGDVSTVYDPNEPAKIAAQVATLQHIIYHQINTISFQLAKIDGGLCPACRAAFESGGDGE